MINTCKGAMLVKTVMSISGASMRIINIKSNKYDKRSLHMNNKHKQ